MTIKKKLFVNMILTVAGIAIIGGVSLVGMKFVQGKLSVLTERSTPYQLKTIEMQRALQEHTANLLKVAFSGSSADLAATREEAEKSLVAVKDVAAGLDMLKAETAGNGSEKVDQLAGITREMIATTESRLQAEEGVRSADQAMKGKLQEISQRLAQMDTSIQKRQKTSAKQLSASSGTAKEITQRLVSLTQARDFLKDLNFSFVEVQKATARKAVLIGRGKIDTALNEFLKNRLVAAGDPSVKSTAEHVSEVKRLMAGPQGFIEVKGRVLSQPGDGETAREYEQLVGAVGGKISAALVEVDHAITIATEKYNIENRNHDDSLRGSNSAGDVLALTGDLSTKGLDIKSIIKELMTVRTIGELDLLTKELHAQFAAVEVVQRKMSAALGAAGKGSEAVALRAVAGSLAEIKTMLLAKEGVVEKLRRVIMVQSEAMALNGKLKELVARQNDEAKVGVTTAQADQAKAVTSVNQVVRNFVFIVSVVGAAIFLFSMVFGRLLAKSISTPIEELTVLSEQFGSGDFSGQMDEKRKDEFGRLAVHLNQATRKIQEIVRQITVAINNLASSSEELSVTAEDLNRGARTQALQTDQSASAMNEMTSTIAEVAHSAGAAADASRQALQAAENGNDAVARTVKGMEDVAVSVREGASLVNQLGGSSEKIGSIVTVINDIADQTNLLALNAAIEAARAGEMGMGFAVVADEVRKLSSRTTEATTEIAAMIREIQAHTSRAVTTMGQSTGKVEEGMSLAAGAIESLKAIVTVTAQGTEMVERIATAAEQQASVASQVSNSVESIAEITAKSQQATSDITRSSEELARLAAELHRMAEWFQVNKKQAAVARGR